MNAIDVGMTVPFLDHFYRRAADLGARVNVPGSLDPVSDKGMAEVVNLHRAEREIVLGTGSCACQPKCPQRIAERP
jgi:hypothetical protein